MPSTHRWTRLAVVTTTTIVVIAAVVATIASVLYITNVHANNSLSKKYRFHIPPHVNACKIFAMKISSRYNSSFDYLYGGCREAVRYVNAFLYEYRRNSTFRKLVFDKVLSYGVVREFVGSRKVGRCFTIFQQVIDGVEKYKYHRSLANCVQYYPPTGYTLVYDKKTGTVKAYVTVQLMTVFVKGQGIPKIVKEQYSNLLKYPFITCVLDLYINPKMLKIEKYDLECTPLLPGLYSVSGMTQKYVFVPREIVIMVVLLLIATVATITLILYRKKKSLQT